jgi:hypothetical protein
MVAVIPLGLHPLHRLQLAERSVLSSEVEDAAFRTRLQLAFAGIAAAVTDLRTLGRVVEAEVYHPLDGSAAVLWVWDAATRSMWCYRCVRGVYCTCMFHWVPQTLLRNSGYTLGLETRRVLVYPCSLVVPEWTLGARTARSPWCSSPLVRASRATPPKACW